MHAEMKRQNLERVKYRLEKNKRVLLEKRNENINAARNENETQYKKNYLEML